MKAPRLPVDVLRGDGVGRSRPRPRARRTAGRRRRRRRPGGSSAPQNARVSAGPLNIFQLPAISISADSGIAATPGSSLPSSSSSEAPPPVEIHEISVGEPGLVDRAHRVAAADDREPVAAATAARPRTCPRRSAATRTRPSGRSRTRSSPRRSARELLPRRGPDVEPEPAVRAGRRRARPGLRVRVELAAATTSRGSMTSNGNGFSARTSSAILPPISTGSARAPRFSSTPILSSTFAPPETSTNGRSTSPSSAPRFSSSASRSRPAYAGSRCVTPSVEACARCAEPKASLTKRSQPSASSRAKSASFAVSPGSKRVFSSTSRRSSGSSSRRCSRTGSIGNAGSSVFGRPRCEQTRISAASRRAAAERRQRRADARVVGDPAVLERHVEVGADEDDLAPPTSASRTERGSHALSEQLAIRSTSRHE